MLVLLCLFIFVFITTRFMVNKVIPDNDDDDDDDDTRNLKRELTTNDFLR